MLANQDSLRLQNSPHGLFSLNHTSSSSQDLLLQFKRQIEENKRAKKPYHEGLPPVVKQVSLDSSVQRDIELGDKSNISKSNVGRGVKVGARCKIVNSVILNNVTIGNE